MIFERYILRNYIGPFFFSMAVITFVFIMDFILRYIDLFLGKGVKFHIVLQAFTLSFGHMFALIIPMAVLPATLMTYGTLAGENELTAMRACGFSIYRMILPGMFGGTLLAIGAGLLQQPRAAGVEPPALESLDRHQPQAADGGAERESLHRRRAGLHHLLRGEERPHRRHLRRADLPSDNEQGSPPPSWPRRAISSSSKERTCCASICTDGQIHEIPEDKHRETYRRTTFKNYTLNIRDVDRSLQQHRARLPRRPRDERAHDARQDQGDPEPRWRCRARR